MLINKNLKTLLHSDFRAVNVFLIFFFIISAKDLVFTLLPLEQAGILGISEHVVVVEGAADAGVGGHGLEQLGAVHLLAVQDTPLQKVLGSRGVTWEDWICFLVVFTTLVLNQLTADEQIYSTTMPCTYLVFCSREG